MGNNISSFQTQPIGLLAVYGETAQIREFITDPAKHRAVQTQFYQGRLLGQPVTLAETGQGKVNAAAAAQYMIDRLSVSQLICFGSAGAVASHLAIGDVVVADRVVPHDNGWYTPDTFQQLGVYNGAIPDGRHYRRDWPGSAGLIRIARDAASSVTWPNTPPQIFTGTLASGDQVIASAKKKRWLATTFNALAVDMESAAVAQIATLNHIPWLVIRAVSDQADTSININVSRLITYDETPPTRTQIARKMITSLITDPDQLKAIYQLRQGIRLAAKHAALVTIATIRNLQQKAPALWQPRV
jgi:adenosylhomocysteine nucleosidase